MRVKEALMIFTLTTSVADLLHARSLKVSTKSTVFELSGLATTFRCLNSVVCGDQSAGKSSVLEGISGVPFPRQDGLCTRFPTEIVLRHDSSISRKAASLIPSPSRTPQELELFAAFSREFEEFEELPGIIEEASRLMGVRSSELPDAPAFATDALGLEMIGNTGLHLTLVELPVLISVSNNDNDIQMARSLVYSYLESSRTIILAVIPTSSDAETQTIIQRARHCDKEGL
jgi:hypothetical protein